MNIKSPDLVGKARLYRSEEALATLKTPFTNYSYRGLTLSLYHLNKHSPGWKERFPHILQAYNVVKYRRAYWWWHRYFGLGPNQHLID